MAIPTPPVFKRRHKFVPLSLLLRISFPSPLFPLSASSFLIIIMDHADHQASPNANLNKDKTKVDEEVSTLSS